MRQHNLEKCFNVCSSLIAKLRSTAHVLCIADYVVKQLRSDLGQRRMSELTTLCTGCKVGRLLEHVSHRISRGNYIRIAVLSWCSVAITDDTLRKKVLSKLLLLLLLILIIITVLYIEIISFLCSKHGKTNCRHITILP